MRFKEAKKKAILQYLLEKIAEGTPNIAKLVSETFEIKQNTVFTYINELIHADIIDRVGRGRYVLVKQTYIHNFSQSQGELKDEQIIFDSTLRPYFKALPNNVKGIWEYILGEIINNVIDHSTAENLQIIVQQDSISTKVFIGDDGVGIFKKIKEHFGYPSLDVAIHELFKGKLTTDPEHHSGEGIFFSSKLADRFIIISDKKLFMNNKYEAEQLVDAVEISSGTTVLIELSNSSNKMASEIFNQFAQPDSGFNTTTIPLKNIFDTAPVSRSQAKRICQRLDSFQKVVLDFQDLDWMGQGFAHQIFVVYQKAHPDILLEPINMSEGVAQMYAHVTNREYE